MLKVIIFDSGYGGEFFADRLEEALPILEVIRVIDWRHAELYLTNPRIARESAIEALHPYIGKVDLIIFANHLLSLTSLKYFRRKYPNQHFLGLKLKKPDTFIKRDTLILTTKAVAKTIGYRGFIFHLKRKARTMTPDGWLTKIDDGELTQSEISETITSFIRRKHINPQEIILGCSQFDDIIHDLKKLFGRRIRIYSSFDDTIRETSKLLRIRGGTHKIK
ncbi:hypothetical protein IKE80_00900 [Candidatus Saccharibacteria bacterium]|nr:hypothetical protein [Candidatus Saccharibacteria bacterium]